MKTLKKGEKEYLDNLKISMNPKQSAKLKLIILLLSLTMIIMLSCNIKFRTLTISDNKRRIVCKVINKFLLPSPSKVVSDIFLCRFPIK